MEEFAQQHLQQSAGMCFGGFLFFFFPSFFLPKRSGGYSPLISQLKFCCHQVFAKGILTKRPSTVPILDSCLLIPRGT